MTEEVIKVLDHLGEKFGVAIDWTSQNIAPYLQDLMSRFVKYKITINSILLFFAVIGIGVWIAIFKSAMKEKRQYKYWEWFDEGMGYFWILLILGITLVIVIPLVIVQIIQGIFVPEILIINYIQSFNI